MRIFSKGKSIDIVALLEDKAFIRSLASAIMQVRKLLNDENSEDKKEDEYLSANDKDINLCRSRKMYDVYLKLPQKHKDALVNIINGSTLLDFIVSGCLSDNIAAIWDYCRLALSRAEDVSDLCDIFSFFFDLVNTAGTGNKYIRCNVREGDSYNENTCIFDSGSKTYGQISKVLLQGYKYAGSNGKIVKPTLVHI